MGLTIALTDVYDKAFKHCIKHASWRDMNEKYRPSWVDGGYLWNQIFMGNVYENLTILNNHGYAPTLRSDLLEGTLPDIEGIDDYFNNPSFKTFRRLKVSLYEYVNSKWSAKIDRMLGKDNGWDLFVSKKKQTVFTQVNAEDTFLVLLLIYTVDKIIRLQLLEDSLGRRIEAGVSKEELMQAGLWCYSEDRVWGVTKIKKKRKRSSIVCQDVRDGGDILNENYHDVDDPMLFVPQGNRNSYPMSEVAGAMFRFVDPEKENGNKSDAKLLFKQVPTSMKRNLDEDSGDGSSPKKARRGEKDDDEDEDDDGESTSGTLMTSLTEASMSKALQLFKDPGSRDNVISTLAALLDGNIEQAQKSINLAQAQSLGGDEQDDENAMASDNGGDDE